jgi:hypothetical protein
MYSPPRPKKPKAPETVKAAVSQKAQQLINEHLQPEHVKPPPKKPCCATITLERRRQLDLCIESGGVV